MSAALATPGQLHPRARLGRPAGAPFLVVVILVLVLTQRLAIPLGGDAQVPVTVPAMIALALVGLASGHLRSSASRAAMFGVSLVVLSALTGLSVARGQAPSLLSYTLFVLIYLPSVLVSPEPRAGRAALRFFVDLMGVAAVVALVLFGLQYSGLPYADHLAEIIPREFLLQGFNTADPIRYGSPIYRSNGVIFLEPSFLSMFLGLAAAVSLTLRHRTWVLPVLLSAIVTTEAVNGIVLLVAVVAWMLLVGPRRNLLALVPSAVVAVFFAVATPFASLLLTRSSELGSSNTSASQRLVLPYTELLPSFLSSPQHALIGTGAGAAQRLVVEESGGATVIAAVLPKLLVEYGVVGTVPVLLLVGYLILGRLWVTPWAAGMLPIYLVVNASLLLATIAATTFVFCSLLDVGRGEGEATAPPPRD